ncbi:phytoene/squalene synthase family protein [Haladaptatus sp. NG-WS-4]
MTDTHVRMGKSIQRRTGKTFHLATRLFPRRVRHPTYVLYGFFRICDEVVDDADGVPAETQADHLESLRAQARGTADPDSPVLAAFREMADEYDIPDTEIDTFVDAMATDIEKARYENYAELEAYMNGSAAAVGRMMLAVTGADDPERARPHATALGEAFQLTNFLRDVREDVEERDRIYLPQTTLDRHSVTDEQVRRLAFSDEFAAVMRDELRRAESLYWQGVAGIQYLPADCQFPVLLAAVLYADYHRVIRAQGYDVLSRRPSLGTVRKLSLLARTRWHWRKTRDPETVFETVSTAFPTERQVTDFDRRDVLPAR